VWATAGKAAGLSSSSGANYDESFEGVGGQGWSGLGATQRMVKDGTAPRGRGVGVFRVQRSAAQRHDDSDSDSP
jgi:hypothetical protein